MTHVVAALPNQPSRHIICPRNAINVVRKLLSVSGRKQRKSSRSRRAEAHLSSSQRTKQTSNHASATKPEELTIASLIAEGRMPTVQ
ncbi:hypothetical protein VTL71DRAFT_2271 [Oculimacula yallundae]|uniref:Uncharacterized protein n=1 Tax=Oculimacula yallundae TaxID=86028 RepID=A0ABR4C8G9_9HELO